MKIILEPNVALKLAYTANYTYGLEFSGFGFVNVVGNDFHVYDVVVLNIGTAAYTEIAPEKILPLYDRPDAKKLKCWFHRHPVGNGKIGQHNWSGTDRNTAEKEPLGSVPELVKWSISIVLTPGGWVGRLDKYTPDGVITKHLEVEPNVPEEVFQELGAIRSEKGTWFENEDEEEPRQETIWYDLEDPEIPEEIASTSVAEAVNVIAKNIANSFSAEEQQKLGMNADELMEHILTVYGWRELLTTSPEAVREEIIWEGGL